MVWSVSPPLVLCRDEEMQGLRLCGVLCEEEEAKWRAGHWVFQSSRLQGLPP